MGIKLVKRIAGELLNRGESSIRIKGEGLQRAREAITRSDVDALIKEKLVYAREKGGRKKKEKKKKRGAGRRRGKKHARTPKKEKWMRNIRAQRALLKSLLKEGKISKVHKNSVYKKIKGGAFRGKEAMLMFMKESGMLKQ